MLYEIRTGCAICGESAHLGTVEIGPVLSAVAGTVVNAIDRSGATGVIVCSECAPNAAPYTHPLTLTPRNGDTRNAP